MMRTITLRSYRKSEGDALSDCYAQVNGRVLLLSLIGNDSVVKAVSGTFLDTNRGSDRDLYVNDEACWNGRMYLYRAPGTAFEVITAKLRSGLTHQLIHDIRFLRENRKDQDGFDKGLRYVLVNPGEVPADLVYQSVLRHLPTPTLPEWSHAIYEELRDRSNDYRSPSMGRVTEIESYPEGTKVISVQVTEDSLDAVVSDLVKKGIIGWE
jgi:hypothetical protein